MIKVLTPYLFSMSLIFAVWTAASLWTGPILIPMPWRVFPALGGLLQDVEFWGTIGLTLARGACGLVMALTAALILGIPAGLSPGFIRLLGPLVAALQSCPPVLWISLVLVWVGTGSAVPVVAVFASIFPILFINISQGCLSIDRRLLTMASLYKVSAARKLTHIILPGVTPALLAGLSYALSATWKVAAVAEYLGSGEGIGARIYWAYRMLDIPDLFAWALVLAGIGVGLEMSLVARLRSLAARFRTTTRESA